MRFIPISEARGQLASLLKEGVCALTQHGQPVGVLVDFSTYASLQALLAATRDPDEFARLIKEHEAFVSGEEDPEDVSSAELLDRLQAAPAAKRQLLQR